ncbi:MAG: glycosyltransferase [Egibacteraceae bacterium]
MARRRGVSRQGETHTVSRARNGPMHLLVFSAEPLASGYGSATALRTFIRAALVHSDWRIILVAPGPPADDWQLPPARVRRLAAGGGQSMGRRAQLLGYTAGALLRAATAERLRPDVVLSWQPMPAGLAGAVASRHGGTPHIVRTCGPELARSWSRFPAFTAILRPLTLRVLREADAVVVKSEVEGGLLGPSIDERRVHLIPNAVGPEFFVSRRARAGAATRLLAVCQLEAHKGVAQLLSALGALRDRRGGQVRLTVAGDGSQRARLERAAARAGIEAAFFGRVPHAGVPALCTVHDALVLPSLLEGCANAALEAMAAGLPVIGHRSALRDLVHDGVNGVLAATPDVHGLEQALERFLSAGAIVTGMRIAARRRAAGHSPERLVASYRDLLEDVAG